MPDVIDAARANLNERAELPGMSLMEHLGELRKRIIRAAIALMAGFGTAYLFHVRLVDYIQRPLVQIGKQLTYTHPTDPINFFIKTSLVFGAILASPFIFYQVWMFISPGMYQHEKRYVLPFILTTTALFLGGAWFGYRYVLPGALHTLIDDFGKQFHPMITIEDYTGFFNAVILGLGLTFELPILMFFLALFGIADWKFFLRNFRYAIMIIFVVTAIICPLPDPISMCLFASPMLVLYLLGVVVASFVHPDRRKKKELAA